MQLIRSLGSLLAIGGMIGLYQSPNIRNIFHSMVVAPGVHATASPVAPEISPPKIGYLQDLIYKRETADFAPITLDGSNAASRMQYMLDQAVDRLSDGTIKDLRAHLSEISAERVKITADLGKSRFEAASQGGDPSTDRTVQALQDKLASLDDEAKAAKGDLQSSLEAIGVHLSDQQLDGLLVMATSDSFIDMMSAFANLRSIDAELLRATEASGESAETAKRYYGIHATLAESAAWLQWKFMQDIDGKYLPELQRITTEATTLKQQSAQLLADATDDKSIIEGNIEAQDLTLKVADIYRSELLKQRDSVAQSYQRTSRQVSVAVNTWRTVRVSSDLITMMKSSDEGFHQLLSLQLPDLRPFQGVEIKAEFQRISERLVASK